MNTTEECYQALLDKEWVAQIDSPYRVHLVDGALVNKDGETAYEDFRCPKNWKIYEPPKWYENIPEGGVLAKTTVGLVVEIVSKSPTLYCLMSKCGAPWEISELTTCTKAEIQVWLDNAPEE